MSTTMQLTVQNSTPQTRRFFVLDAGYGRADIADANVIAFRAWQSFLLAPGDSGYTALSSKYQVAARSLMPEAQHQTVLVEADLRTSWQFQLGAGNAPELVALDYHEGTPEIKILGRNATSGVAQIAIYNNFAPLWVWRPLPSQGGLQWVQFSLVFYASVAVVDPEQPIVLEANIGEFPVKSPPSRLTAQYRQDNGVTAWRFT